MDIDPILELELRRHIQIALDAADQMEDSLVAVHLCSALEVLDSRAHRNNIDGGDGG